MDYMENSLSFIAPTNGHVKVKVHDEAYARVHLGFIGVNIELFLARVCFKGGAEYSINILQVKGTCHIQSRHSCILFLS